MQRVGAVVRCGASASGGSHAVPRTTVVSCPAEDPQTDHAPRARDGNGGGVGYIQVRRGTMGRRAQS